MGGTCSRTTDVVAQPVQPAQLAPPTVDLRSLPHSENGLSEEQRRSLVRILNQLTARQSTAVHRGQPCPALHELRQMANSPEVLASAPLRQNLAACVRDTKRLETLAGLLRTQATQQDALLVLLHLSSDKYDEHAAETRNALRATDAFQDSMPLIYLSPCALGGGRLVEGGFGFSTTRTTVYLSLALASNLCSSRQDGEHMQRACRTKLAELATEPPAADSPPGSHPNRWAGPHICAVANGCLNNMNVALARSDTTVAMTDPFEVASALEELRPDLERRAIGRFVNENERRQQIAREAVAREATGIARAPPLRMPASPRRLDDGVVALLARLSTYEFVPSLPEDQEKARAGEVEGKGEAQPVPITRQKSADVCPICLDPFAPGDTLRALPCTHAFHMECVDTWLLSCEALRRGDGATSSCPMCRFDLRSMDD
jgi:hypothetical protein